MRKPSLPVRFATIATLSAPLIPATAFCQALPAASVMAVRSLPPPKMTYAGEDGKTHTLSILRANVSVLIMGPLAQTTLTLTFKNDTNRVLEGNLDLPLPEKAVLAGYALNVRDAMIEGVPVEKAQARQIFEQEERRQVDPGLLEQTTGNNFRTRVYPLPPMGTRTIRIKYVSDLVAANGDLIYSVPLRWSETIPEAHFFLDVRQNPVAPRLTFGGREHLLPVHAIGAGALSDPTHYVMEATLENTPFNDDLTVHLPGLANHGHAAVEQFSPSTGSSHPLNAPGYFFAISDAPPLGTNPQLQSLQLARPASRPAHIGVVWDASLSRLHSDTRHELQLLADALRAIGNATVDVVVLRNVAEPAKAFHVTNGNSSELCAFLRAQPFDGGTDLSAFHFAHGVKKSSDVFYLLFTDGIDTLAGDAPPLASAPVYAVTTDPRANHDLLRHLSEASGGAYLNLASMSDRDAVAAMGRNPLSLLNVTATRGEIGSVYPAGVQPLAGRTTVSGRILTPTATIVLNYGFRDPATGHEQVVAHHEYTLHQSDAARGAADGLVARFWARQAVSDLALQPERNHDALLALGRAFNVVTPTTSFLVLESLQQYLEYGIEPPRSQPAIYQEWNKLHQSTTRNIAAERAAKLQEVIGLWREKVQWYEHPPKREVPKKEMLDGLRPGLASGRGVNVGGFAAGAPRPEAMAYRGGTANVHTEASMSRNAAAFDSQMQHVVGGDAPSYTINSVNSSDPRSDLMRVGSQYRDNPRGTAAADAATTTRGRVQSLPVAGYAIRDTGNNFVVRRAGAGRGSAGRAKSATRQVTDADGYALTSSAPLAARVAIKAWSPDTPYLHVLRAAGPANAYAAYLKERSRGGYETSPAFYLDCAEYLIQNGQTALGVRVLTGIADLKMEQTDLIRIVAHRLEQLGYRDTAIRLFEEILRLRPEEPQSDRDLALALADRADDEAAHGSPRSALTDDNRALRLLNEVVLGKWDGRFPEIETIALTEANRIIVRAHANRSLAAGLVVPIDARLIQNMSCDVRILLTWNTDETDQDLWVIEPTGEKCYYDNRFTALGGRLSHDFTQGYGPEEYLLRKSVHGKYKIQTNYFGQHSPELDGGTTVQATVITDWGRPAEKRQYLTIRLNQAKDVVDVGTITR